MRLRYNLALAVMVGTAFVVQHSANAFVHAPEGSKISGRLHGISNNQVVRIGQPFRLSCTVTNGGGKYGDEDWGPGGLYFSFRLQKIDRSEGLIVHSSGGCYSPWWGKSGMDGHGGKKQWDSLPPGASVSGSSPTYAIPATGWRGKKLTPGKYTLFVTAGASRLGNGIPRDRLWNIYEAWKKMITITIIN